MPNAKKTDTMLTEEKHMKQVADKIARMNAYDERLKIANQKNIDEIDKLVGLVNKILEKHGITDKINKHQIRFNADYIGNITWLENSDIISYHNYSPIDHHQNAIDSIMSYGRPVICTEYMARTTGSTFQSIMPVLKKHNIGAIHWGLVSGKTNTIYAWDTPIADMSEPEVWFHDIFRTDGSPYSQEEVDLIKLLSAE